jgi:hypothetical protein
MIRVRALHRNATTYGGNPVQCGLRWLGSQNYCSRHLHCLSLYRFSRYLPAPTRLRTALAPAFSASRSADRLLSPQEESTQAVATAVKSASETVLSLEEATLQHIRALPSTEDWDGSPQKHNVEQKPQQGPVIHIPSAPKPWENEKAYFKYRLKLAYDGTNYWGWQVQLQSGLPTVQGRVEVSARRPLLFHFGMEMFEIT